MGAGHGPVAIFIGVVALRIWSEEPTFGRLRPWLESLSAPARAVVGLLVSTCAAAPWAVRLLPRVRRWTRWPVGAWMFAVGVCLVTVWLPPRGGSGWEAELFRERAGWYIVTSLMAFVGTVLWVEVALSARDFPGGPEAARGGARPAP